MSITKRKLLSNLGIPNAEEVMLILHNEDKMVNDVMNELEEINPIPIMERKKKEIERDIRDLSYELPKLKSIKEAVLGNWSDYERIEQILRLVENLVADCEKDLEVGRYEAEQIEKEKIQQKEVLQMQEMWA